jgi:hypothetical protein
VPTFTGKVSDDTLEKMKPTYQPTSFSPKNDVIDNLIKTLRNEPAGVNSQSGNLSDDRINNIMRLLENPSTTRQEKDVVSEIRKALNIDSLPQSKAILENVEGPKQANETIRPSGEDDAKDLIDLYGDIDFSKLKDISGLRAYTTDIYRNTEDVFGQHFPKIKESLLDPFDQSKKEFVELQEEWLNKLQKEVVEGLGIKKGSKLSKLVQDYGEKTITLDELKQKAPKDWQRVVEADKWFRKAYDELIDQVNKVRATIYPNNPEKLVPKRQDYYRHFRELNGLEGIRNLFDTPAGIDPRLVGTSDFTKPNTRWASFMQKRGLGPYKSDAVGGFLDYLPAASYSIKIDPHIKNFREFSKALKEATEESKNLNTFIEFLEDFTNDLAGKTNPFDRAPQKILGRKAFNFLNALNTRVKKNVLLGNVGTLLAQFGNIPNGIAFAKHHSVPGAIKTIASLIDKNAPSKQSGFLKERFSHSMYDKFNTRLIEQPEKFLGWLMTTADRMGTTFIWNSAYQKALSKGVKDPIKYADDATRKLVAGRGIGEVPLAQKSKLTQLIAPFQLEVANLWKVQRDFLKEKDFGALLTLYVSAMILNKIMEATRGSSVTFDPLGALIDAINDEDATNIERVGRVAGEVLSNVPFGQTLANFYPEYGTKHLPTREEFFGDNDPNRFGSGLLIAKGVQDPLAKLALPYGGNQVEKTYEGYEALKKEGIYDRDGDQLKYPVEDDVINRIKGILFGPSAFKESREYYDKQRRPLSERQTMLYEAYKEQGAGKQYYDDLIKKREMKKIERMINELKKNKEMTEKEKQEKFYELMNRLQELQKAN